MQIFCLYNQVKFWIENNDQVSWPGRLLWPLAKLVCDAQKWIIFSARFLIYKVCRNGLVDNSETIFWRLVIFICNTWNWVNKFYFHRLDQTYCSLRQRIDNLNKNKSYGRKRCIGLCHSKFFLIKDFDIRLLKKRNSYNWIN